MTINKSLNPAARAPEPPPGGPATASADGAATSPAELESSPLNIPPSQAEDELLRRLSLPPGEKTKSRDQFRAFMDAAEDAILIADYSNQTVVEANSAACALTGYAAAELCTLPVRELLAPVELDAIDRIFAELKKRGRAWRPNLRMQRKGGALYFGEVRITLYGPADRPLAAAIVRDVSARIDREEELTRSYAALELTQQRLSRSESKYRTLVEAAADAIVILDSHSGRFVEANRSACDLFGYRLLEFRELAEQALFSELQSDADTARSLRMIREEPGFRPNVRMRRRDGSSFWAEVQATSYDANDDHHTMAIIRDVTWRVEREQELAASYRMLEETQTKLVQAGKMSAMGEIGAGIAHELNQPITTIQGFAQRIFRHPKAAIGDHADELQIIIDESARMARIVDNIRTFARQSNFDPEPIDPILPVRNALELLGAQLKMRGIDVTLDAADPLPRIDADRARLQQVFLNLIVNARDALAEVAEDHPKQIRLSLSWEGDFIRYVVEDTGPGIPAALVQRVFEPFYTSKPPGEGTGLGLSIAYGIVSDHAGEIQLEQGQQGGARFVVTLPVARKGSMEPGAS